jgi:hypothetical protein
MNAMLIDAYGLRYTRLILFLLSIPAARKEARPLQRGPDILLSAAKQTYTHHIQG